MKKEGVTHLLLARKESAEAMTKVTGKLMYATPTIPSGIGGLGEGDSGEE